MLNELSGFFLFSVPCFIIDPENGRDVFTPAGPFQSIEYARLYCAHRGYRQAVFRDKRNALLGLLAEPEGWSPHHADALVCCAVSGCVYPVRSSSRFCVEHDQDWQERRRHEERACSQQQLREAQRLRDLERAERAELQRLLNKYRALDQSLSTPGERYLDL